MTQQDLSWQDVADKEVAGFCPSSPDYDEPHIVTDGKMCDECGAQVEPVVTVEYTNGVTNWGPLFVDSMAAAFARLDAVVFGYPYPSAMLFSIFQDGVCVWEQQGTDIHNTADRLEAS